ncbi:MAG: hypothetical protein QOJ94_357 [Sphingomonadales bacterium]|nr:hypothetical protein [Sphingomonadales bacterium]
MAECGTGKGAPAASLLEISRVLEETARLVRHHACGEEIPPHAVPAASGEAAEAGPGPEADPRWIRTLLDLRGLRREFLGLEASDAMLAMLLTLYQAGLERRPLYRTAAAVEAHVAETTAFRATEILVATGAVHRTRDAADKRLIILRLSEQMTRRLRAYLATAAAMALPLV